MEKKPWWSLFLFHTLDRAYSAEEPLPVFRLANFRDASCQKKHTEYELSRIGFPFLLFVFPLLCAHAGVLCA